MKKFLIFILCITGLYGLFGCEEKDNGKIVVAEVTHSVFYAPQYIAYTEGYFEKYGLDVEFILTSGADLVMASLISKEAQIGLMGPEASIYVYTQGKTDYAINFGQLTQKDGAFIVGREDDDDFKLSDLKNKEILGGRKGGVPCMSLQYILTENGLQAKLDDENAEVNVRTDVAFPAMAGAFTSGEADYTTLFEPTASMLEREGNGYVLSSVGEHTDAVAYTCYSSLKSYFESNKKDLINFTKAIAEAQKFVYDNTDAVVAASIKEFFLDTDDDLLVSSIKRYRDIEAWAKTPELTKDELNHLMDIMISAGELKSYASYDALVDSSIFKSI